MSPRATKKHPSPPLWEWILAAIGAVLILSALGTVLYHAATEVETPAAFEIKVVSESKVGESYVVNFRLTNNGTHTAAALNVEGALTRGSEEIEKSTASITYVPPGSEREGALFFTKNPNDNDLAIRVTGYEKP